MLWIVYGIHTLYRVKCVTTDRLIRHVKCVTTDTDLPYRVDTFYHFLNL